MAREGIVPPRAASRSEPSASLPASSTTMGRRTEMARERDPESRLVADDSDPLHPLPPEPRGEITGRHDEGSGANETVDGLDELEEERRRATEDVATNEERQRIRAIPVFERGDLPPKI
jgi:hypothetical protein